MKKCCFIIPYFGEFPNMFPIFLKTCSYNKNFDWLIFTDVEKEYDYPENVRVVIIPYKDFKKLIQSKFEFKISIDEPHKLCDYNPAYGYIFEEYLQDYKFWGHCDIDTIMGDLDKFITYDLLNKYDKLFCLGHMILYRNSKENNRVFMNKYEGRLLYKDSFTSKKTTIFDETYGGRENINSIFLEKNPNRVFQEDWSANFLIQPSKFIKTTYNWEKGVFVNDKKRDDIYIWNNGKIYRYYIENNNLIVEEYMYMHFQLRRMSYDLEILNLNKFKIIPEAFKKIEYWPITKENFNKIKKWQLTAHYFYMKKHNLKHKLAMRKSVKSKFEYLNIII